MVAALILSRLVVTVHNVLEFMGSVETFLWTDSTVALCWINNHKPWKQYVSSRVNEIHRHTSGCQWYHCPGHLNPADIPSRGISGSKLYHNEPWWNGPQLTEDNWPSMMPFDTCEEAQLEMIKTPISHSFVQELISVAPSALISSWFVVSVTAVVRVLLHYRKFKNSKFVKFGLPVLKL